MYKILTNGQFSSVHQGQVFKLSPWKHKQQDEISDKRKQQSRCAVNTHNNMSVNMKHYAIVFAFSFFLFFLKIREWENKNNWSDILVSLSKNNQQSWFCRQRWNDYWIHLKHLFYCSFPEGKLCPLNFTAANRQFCSCVSHGHWLWRAWHFQTCLTVLLFPFACSNSCFTV